MKHLYIAFFIVLFVKTNSVFAQSNVSYNLKVGDQFEVNQVADQAITQDMNGQKHKIKNFIEGEYIFLVKEVSDSLYVIQFRFKHFKMKSTSNLAGELFNVDTELPVEDDDIEGKIFSQLTKSDLTMTMYKTGKIKQIIGSEALIENMINAAGDFDNFTKELMKESMRSEFSNESLASSFEQMTFIYPTGPVKIGDSWKNRFEGDLSAHNTWTLKNVSKDEVSIEGNSLITLNAKDNELDMNLTGNMTSEITTSKDTGFVKLMTTKSEASGVSILHNMNNLEVPTTIVSNITYKVKRHV